MASVCAMALPQAASAATWVSTLNSSDAQSNGPWGTVTLDELDANTVEVTLLLAPGYKIVDTGAHHAFTFNLVDSPNSSVSIVTPTGGTNPLTYLGEGSFGNPPFGSFANAFSCCGPGANNSKTTPFTFTVSNASGISFAGQGYTTDTNGNLASFGTGNRFGPNSGGWWFAVDVIAPNGGPTGAVGAGTPVLVTTPVPEPATWAMMIGGFGLLGAAVRRRRAAGRAIA
jgi:hypothetical protein